MEPKTYIVEGQTTTLSCFICSEPFRQSGESNKKQLKKLLTQTVLAHIHEKHFAEGLVHYRRKVLKSFVREVSLAEMHAEVKQGKHTHIEIIDRENAGSYENF